MELQHAGKNWCQSREAKRLEDIIDVHCSGMRVHDIHSRVNLEFIAK